MPNPVRLAAICGQALSALAAAQSIAFPADANVRSVAEYGALPNDGIDDTSAFQAAIQDNIDRWRILYIPDGVYDFSDRLNLGSGAGYGFPFGHALRLQGQSQAGTILRLRPNTPSFSGSNGSSKVFIDVYEGNTANAFGNELHNITIEIGQGNAGAVGVQFQSSNTGSIRDITIRSLDPAHAGRIGLDFAFEFPGPLLAKNITIDGFEKGVLGAPQEYSVTIEGLTLRNQTVVGLDVWRLPMQIHNFTSTNSVPAVRNQANPGAWGHVVIDEANFSGGSPNTDAIINENDAGAIFVRNLTTTGYRFAINDVEAGVTRPDGFVAQHTTDATLTLFPTSASSLHLAAYDASFTPAPLSEWVSVTAFGAVANDNLDDTQAIQAAMDSGASTIYFPSGSYALSDTITLGPAVRHIQGLKSFISTWSGLWMKDATHFRVPGNQPMVMIEGLNPGSTYGRGSAYFIEQAAPNTLIIRDGGCDGFRNTVGGGRTIFENIVGNDYKFDANRVWARQFNPEGSGTKITNIGGDVYLLGLKTEGAGTMVDTRDGGRTEVMGGLNYPASAVGADIRMFLVSNASLTASMPESCYSADGFHNIWVTQTLGVSIRDLLRSSIIRGHSNCGLNLNLFNAIYDDTTPPGAPGVPNAGGSDLHSVAVSWTPSVDVESGIARYNVYNAVTNQLLLATRAPSAVVGNLPDASTISVSIRAVNGAGIEGPASSAVQLSTTRDTTPPSVVLARVDTPTRTTITFSEPVAAGASTAHYTIDHGATVISARSSPDGSTITLTTSPLTPGAGYTLHLSNITDLARTPNHLDGSADLTLMPGLQGEGTGLTASYFPNIDLSGAPTLTRLDPVINFDFGYGSPAPGFPSDNFSARWSGRITAKFSETYTFYTTTDDGARLWIDGKGLINAWNFQAPTTYSGTIALEAGKSYDLRMEYFEAGYGAMCRLEWSSPSTPREVIPVSQLSPQPVFNAIIRTSDGAGADAQLSKASDTDDGGTAQAVGTYFDPFDFIYDRACLFRFDLSSAMLAANQLDDAEMTLTLSGFGNGDGIRVMQAFGLRDDAHADTWIESGPGHVSWHSLPGTTGTANHADPASWVYLGQIVVDNAGYSLNNSIDRLVLRSAALSEWLSTDTDGLATVMIKRATQSTEGTGFNTKEYAANSAPALKLALSPRAATCVGDWNLDGGVDFADVEAFFRDWESGQSNADVNLDGGVDGEDISSFFARWESGC